MSSHSSLKSVVALAFADEVLADPSLLEAFGRAIDARDDVTLLVFAPDADPGELEAALAPIAVTAGLTTETGADVVAVAAPGGDGTTATLLETALCVITARDAAAPFHLLPSLHPEDAGVLREIARSGPGFVCNVCGEPGETPLATLDRETPSCAGCGSTPRFRSVVHALSLGLFGESIPLPAFPSRPDLTGIGLSDWAGYADRLAEKLGYRNTFLHQEPLLDIANPDPAGEGTLDFLISSEVFEHVSPPLGRALEGAFRLLKPGGLLVLTLPYVPVGKTVEHFPELHDWRLVEHEGATRLENTTVDGRLQVFDDLTFHGGPGQTLEMRVCALPTLRAELEAAGFSEIVVLSEDAPAFGVCWPGAASRPILARKPRETVAGVGRSWRASSTLGGPDETMPERAFPGMPDTRVMREHVMRYAFALDLVAGLDVLDVGCGTGYGSEMLTWTASSVTGVDRWQPDEDERPSWSGAASFRYGHDVCREPLPRAGAAVMLEVLEHLEDPRAALRSIWRAAPLLVLSFPNPRYHGSHHNPYHLNDWSLEQLEDELEAAASGVYRRLVLEHFVQGADGLILPGRDPEASYWLLVARAEGEIVEAVPVRHLADVRAEMRQRQAGPELIVCHIPKTAGTSLRGALAAAYGEHEVVHDQADRVADPASRFSTDFDGWLAEVDIELQSPFPWPRVVSGHFWLGKYARAFPAATRVTWLREPAARIVSWFTYWRSLPLEEGNPVHAAVKDGRMGLEEFAAQDIVRDQMTRIFLRGYALEDLHFVGIVEHFDEDLSALAALLGWPRVETLYANRTPQSAFASPPDPGLLAAIRELNPADTALYRRALELRETRPA